MSFPSGTRFTEAAQADFDSAVEQAIQDGGGRARHLADITDAVLKHLLSFPASGRMGKLAGSREFLLPGLPFILPYRFEANVLVILRFIHTSRQWPPRPSPRKKR